MKETSVFIRGYKTRYEILDTLTLIQLHIEVDLRNEASDHQIMLVKRAVFSETFGELVDLSPIIETV